MRKKSLKFKISVYLTLVLSVAVVIFSLVFFKLRQEELLKVISTHVTQVSETIVASTRYTMLVNKRDVAEKIIDDIAKQKDIVRVRVISSDGTIIHSKKHAETGYSVEQSDEPCVQCHRDKTPLTEVPDSQRWKVVDAGDGHRVMTVMQPIRNEPSCSSSSCHEHAPSQKVLGVVDVAYSLDEIDQSLKGYAVHFAGISLLCVLGLSTGVGFMLQRLVYVPLNDLDGAAQRISAGELEQQVPVRSGDDFGRVAESFNTMSAALHESRLQMEDLVLSLESKVEERTRELLAARAEVAQGVKLAAIGVLASGIAHELNNPLTGVLTFTSLMRKKAVDGSEDAEDLDLVIRETKRCASIIKRLLDFAREKVPTSGYYQLNQVVDDTVRMVDKPAALQQVRIVRDFEEHLPDIWGDADLIKQVVMNLLVNAQQAIVGSGTVTVGTRLHQEAGQQTMVELTVTDTGCGIPAAHLERIFDPFFTSKEVGKGTGLGLSVSYGIVRTHGGRISVESSVGEGSSFHVFLPVDAPHAKGAAPSTGESL
ncbi:MAG: HAMP domain-containing protein [Rhodoferax sp.]|nr:HAMP domain-containing protein [Rhodoferax sp.]